MCICSELRFNVTTSGCETDLWGCRGGAVRSSGTGRMDQRRTPAAGSAWAAWSRSAAAPPSSPNAAVTPSNPSPPPERGWSPDGRHLLLLSRLHPRRPGPACRRSGRSAKGRRAACWCRGIRRPEVLAPRGWANRRCCLGMFAGRCGRARRCQRCHNRETGSWRGGTPSSVTSGQIPVKVWHFTLCETVSKE